MDITKIVYWCFVMLISGVGSSIIVAIGPFLGVTGILLTLTCMLYGIVAATAVPSHQRWKRIYFPPKKESSEVETF